MIRTNRRRARAAAVLLGLSAWSLASVALAQQAPKPENLIRWRQSAFQLVAWSNGRIKANLDGSYNKEEVQRAANVLSAVASSDLASLFAPGTEQGKGWHDTTAKPELFRNPAQFAELAGRFSRDAGELAQLAAQGDAARVKEQFGKLGKTCKSCHDEFKNKE